MTINPSMRLKPGPRSGKGGRPCKVNSLFSAVRVDTELHDILYGELRPKERFNDTIKRIIREKAELKQENEQLKSQIKNC